MTKHSVSNYVEYYLCKPFHGEHKHENMFETALSKEDFTKAFDYLVKVRHLRYHEYQVRETMVNNVFVRHTIEPSTQKNDQIKQQVYLVNLYERTPIQPIATNERIFLRLCFQRETAPAHNIPSSQHIFKDVFIQYMSVRLSKQIFINFEKQYNPQEAPTRKIDEKNINHQPIDNTPCVYTVKIVVWNYPLTEDQEREIHFVMIGLLESISESVKTIGM